MRSVFAIIVVGVGCLMLGYCCGAFHSIERTKKERELRISLQEDATHLEAASASIQAGIANLLHHGDTNTALKILVGGFDRSLVSLALEYERCPTNLVASNCFQNVLTTRKMHGWMTAIEDVDGPCAIFTEAARGLTAGKQITASFEKRLESLNSP